MHIHIILSAHCWIEQYFEQFAYQDSINPHEMNFNGVTMSIDISAYIHIVFSNPSAYITLSKITCENYATCMSILDNSPKCFPIVVWLFTRGWIHVNLENSHEKNIIKPPLSYGCSMSCIKSISVPGYSCHHPMTIPHLDRSWGISSKVVLPPQCRSMVMINLGHWGNLDGKFIK